MDGTNAKTLKSRRANGRDLRYTGFRPLARSQTPKSAAPRATDPKTTRLRLVALPRAVYTKAMSVEEIEAAISELSPDELAQLADWFRELQAKVWDQQLEADVKAGKLDRLARQAKEDFAGGKCTPL